MGVPFVGACFRCFSCKHGARGGICCLHMQAIQKQEEEECTSVPWLELQAGLDSNAMGAQFARCTCQLQPGNLGVALLMRGLLDESPLEFLTNSDLEPGSNNQAG